MKKRWSPLLLVAVVYFAGGEAQAQRAGDNVLTAAQDAFGTTVGNESIGLYSTSSARGFSPVQAGNVRIEGLYIYQPSAPASQNGLDSHLSKSSTVRVGLTAQSYPFPAPTGIADYQLRMPGEKLVTSVVASYGPYDTYTGEVDAKIPLVPEKLGLVLGVGGGYETYTYGADTTGWSAAVLLHWRPTENLEFIPFWSRTEKYNWELPPFTSTAGDYLPPKVKRRAHRSQPWADGFPRDLNYGVLGRLRLGSNWVLRTGLFRSKNDKPKRKDLFLLNVQPDGSGDLYSVKDAHQWNSSYSGEVRASGIFTEGPRRHTVHLATRGYTTRRTTGGSDRQFVGRTDVGVYKVLPEPVFTLGEQGLHKTRQGALGIGYEGAWLGVGETSFGVQKSFYGRTVEGPGIPRKKGHSRPWLYYGTLALFASRDLTIYGSYSRGLEESAVAPDNAANRGDSPPANITEQVDAGIRYAITPDVRLVAGVFEVRKPYLDRDAANIFTTVGSIKHRGVELSLSGKFADGLTVLAGAVLLRARVLGLSVDRGLISPIPAGTKPRVLRLNVQYGPPAWRGLSVDARVEHQSAQPANRLNTFKSPSDTILNIGGRYQFAFFQSPASFRVQVLNVTNSFRWNVNGSSGLYLLGDGRRYTARLSVDF